MTPTHSLASAMRKERIAYIRPLRELADDETISSDERVAIAYFLSEKSIRETALALATDEQATDAILENGLQKLLAVVIRLIPYVEAFKGTIYAYRGADDIREHFLKLEHDHAVLEKRFDLIREGMDAARAAKEDVSISVKVLKTHADRHFMPVLKPPIATEAEAYRRLYQLIMNMTRIQDDEQEAYDLLFAGNTPREAARILGKNPQQTDRLTHKAYMGFITRLRKMKKLPDAITEDPERTKERMLELEKKVHIAKGRMRLVETGFSLEEAMATEIDFEPERLLLTPIEDLPLSLKAHKFLSSSGFETLKDIAGKKRTEIGNYKGIKINRKSGGIFIELTEMLRQLGLSWSEEEK